MKIVVTSGPQDAISTSAVLTFLTTQFDAAFLNGEQDPLLYTGPVPYAGPVDRNLTLNEDFDLYGRLIARQGTTDNSGLTTIDGLTIKGRNNQGLSTWGRAYLDYATETPSRGATEVWNIYNLTGDTHPIHFHLVNVQIIQRASFDVDTPIFSPIPGTERAPDPNERGWKDTVRMNPEEVTTVIAKFDLPVLPVAMGDPISPRTGGHEYVWHCHILDHEEHDMMRPLLVI
jgi:spore coat protein A